MTETPSKDPYHWKKANTDASPTIYIHTPISTPSTHKIPPSVTSPSPSPSPSPTSRKEEAEVELRFIFDEKHTDIVTRVEQPVENVRQLANYVSKLFNVPFHTLYFFRYDIRIRRQQDPLLFDTPVTQLNESGGMMVHEDHKKHFYVYWTHLAEEPSNWILKRDRLRQILKVAEFQLNLDLRFITFQLFDTFAQLPNAPDDAQLLIKQMKKDVQSRNTDKGEQWEGPLERQQQQDEEEEHYDVQLWWHPYRNLPSNWQSSHVTEALNQHYSQIPSNQVWDKVQGYFLHYHKQVLNSISTLQQTISSLNLNAHTIQKNLRTELPQGADMAPASPVDLQARRVHDMTMYPEVGEMLYGTMATQSIDLSLLSNLWDMQHQAAMLDRYKCEADSLWSFAMQIETRKRLWIARDQVRFVMEVLGMWKEGDLKEADVPEEEFKKRLATSETKQYTLQGSVVTCFPKFNKIIKYSE